MIDIFALSREASFINRVVWEENFVSDPTFSSSRLISITISFNLFCMASSANQHFFMSSFWVSPIRFSPSVISSDGKYSSQGLASRICFLISSRNFISSFFSFSGVCICRELFGSLLCF